MGATWVTWFLLSLSYFTENSSNNSANLFAWSSCKKKINHRFMTCMTARQNPLFFGIGKSGMMLTSRLILPNRNRAAITTPDLRFRMDFLREETSSEGTSSSLSSVDRRWSTKQTIEKLCLEPSSASSRKTFVLWPYDWLELKSNLVTETERQTCIER